MEGRPQQNAAGANQRIPVQEFAARYQTKKEVYDFLTINCEAYQPPQDTITIWHLRDQATGQKGYIKGTEVCHLNVPYYENLTLKEITEWGTEHHPAVMARYFSQKRELNKFPRQVSIQLAQVQMSVY